MPSFEEMSRVETQFTRSFAVVIAIGVAGLLVAVVLARVTARGDASRDWFEGLFFLVRLAAYVWYGWSVRAAALAIGDPPFKYVAWLVAAPIVGWLELPLISLVIGVSPLAIRFLLGGHLKNAVRQAQVDELHA